MFSLWKQTCVDCHFFVQEARGLSDRPITLEITEDKRRNARAGDYSWHKEHYAIACDFAVWDEGHNFDRSRQHQILTQTDRRGVCFFWRHRPGMLLPAARILQQREAEAHEARKDRRLAIIGLWIAAFALLVDVYLRIAERFAWWPFMAR